MTFPQVAEILALYATGLRSFRELDLDQTILDFSGASLMDIDFSESFITANFRGANLQRAMFTDANVKTCDFRGADLTGACFDGAALDGAVFDGAILADATFVGAGAQGRIYGTGERPI